MRRARRVTCPRLVDTVRSPTRPLAAGAYPSLMTPMFEPPAYDGFTAVLLTVAAIAGLLLAALLTVRWLSGDPEARSFRATDRRSRVVHVAETALPWLLGLAAVGSLLWAVTIQLGRGG